jgi:hypothetical protein
MFATTRSRPLALVMIAHAAWLCAATASAAPTNPLANPDQRDLESRALRLLFSKPVQAQIAFVTDRFGAQPFAATPEGRATLAGAAAEIAFSGAVGAVNQDPARPNVEWLWTPAHDWFGLHVPTAKVLMPNVDNVFRLIPVDGTSHYRITATPTGPLPTQVTLQLLPGLPGEANWAKVIQELLDTDIQPDTGGGYTLTVGPEPLAGAHNHIATTPASRFILVRDTVADWAHQNAYHLTVTRLDGPPPAPLASETAQAQIAASLIHQTADQVLGLREKGFLQGPPNVLTPPKVREGGRWGLSASGHFRLADDEALVLTLDLVGAQYLAVQLANGWLGSLDYRNHTASLNNFQASPNADGSCTFVIAPRDPHTRNWLDTTGLHEGTMFVRWQKLPTAASAAPAVRSVKLVKAAGLSAVVSASVRRQEVLARAAGYARRFQQ